MNPEIEQLFSNKGISSGYALLDKEIGGWQNGDLIIDLHIEAIPGGHNIPKGQQLQFQIDTFRKVISRTFYTEE